MRLLLAALALVISPCFAQTVTLTPVPPDPAAADEYFLSVTGTGQVQIALAGGTVVDWIKTGASAGGGGGTVVPTTPAIGANNNDGSTASTFTVTAPVLSSRTDFDGAAFSGATVTVGGQSKPLVLTSGIWSASFGTTPDPPPPPAATGNVTLTWEAPTQNTDGTPLTDLAGFKVYWGTQSGSYPQSASLGNVLTYRVENLTAGLWFFAVTAVNAGGIESEHSDEVSKLVEVEEPPPPPPPTDPCVADPLLRPTNLAWPTSRTGSRTLRWSSPRSIVRVDYSWPLGQTQRATWTDDRGCSVTVTR